MLIFKMLQIKQNKKNSQKIFLNIMIKGFKQFYFSLYINFSKKYSK